MHDWGNTELNLLDRQVVFMPSLRKNRYLALHYVSRNYKNGAAKQDDEGIPYFTLLHGATVLPLGEDSKIVKCNLHLFDPWEVSQAQER